MATSIGARTGFPVHKMPEGSETLAIPLAKVGIEIECENVLTFRDDDGTVGQFWQMIEDGSLRNNGREFITRGGIVGKDLVKAIRVACRFFTMSEYDEGYPRAGIHLHVDMTDMNEESDTQLLHAVLSYMLFEKAMFRFAGDWRAACGFCDPLYQSQRDFAHISELLYSWNNYDIGKVRDRNFSKYQAINFLPLVKFGTIEFRQLPTTFNEERILAWVNLCLSFKRYGKEVDVDPVEYLEANGFDRLCDSVFGKHLHLIKEFIKPEEVYDAIAEARALRIGRKKQPVSESWDAPDNPLLVAKAAAKPKKPSLEEANAVVEEAVAPAPRRVQRPLRRNIPQPVPPGGRIRAANFGEEMPAPAWMRDVENQQIARPVNPIAGLVRVDDQRIFNEMRERVRQVERNLIPPARVQRAIDDIDNEF